jgi:hypothetical protein
MEKTKRLSNRNGAHRRRVANKNKNVNNKSGNSKKTKKHTLANQAGGSSKKEKFQVTTFRSINQDDLNRFKLSNYVNNNIDWGIMPGPPPTDCCIM